jgi:nitrogenase molybdenum-iron protein alpha/beta subunit
MVVVSEAAHRDAVSRALEVAERSREPVKAGVEAIVAMAEVDPEGVRAALWRLQADWGTLERLEEQLGGEPVQTALRIGAAIHLARAELASPAPQLRQRLPELMEWLSGAK